MSSTKRRLNAAKSRRDTLRTGFDDDSLRLADVFEPLEALRVLHEDEIEGKRPQNGAEVDAQTIN